MSGYEPALIGAAAGLVTAGVTVAGFWLALGTRIGKVESSVSGVYRNMAETENSIKDVKASLVTSQAGMQLFRESTIRDFVAHEHLNALERRLVNAQTQSETRVTEAINGMSQRLDRLIERSAVD